MGLESRPMEIVMNSTPKFEANRLLILAAICSLGLAGCEPVEVEGKSSAQELQAQMQTLGAEIEELVKDKSCANTAECKTLAMGSNPCGGPRSYLIYSSARVAEETLASKVKQFSELQAEHNRTTGAVGACIMVMPPTIGCVDSVCAAQDTVFGQ